MTSHVSRGRLASLVGKRFVVVGLRVYFAGIQSLFALISLTHNDKIMILFCIGAGGYRTFRPGYVSARKNMDVSAKSMDDSAKND